MSVVGRGVVEGYLTPEEVARICARQGSAQLPLDGKRVHRPHPGRHADDADAADVRHPRARARAARRGARLSRRARHAHADERRAAEPRWSAGRSSTAAPATRRIFNHRWDDPGDVRDARNDSRARDRGAHRRPAAAGRAGRAQPPRRRVRPRPHLRSGLSARGRRLLGRHEVSLPGHRRAARSSTSRTGSARSSRAPTCSARSTRRCARSSTAPRRCSQTPLSLLALVVTYEGVAGVFCGDAGTRRVAAGGRAVGAASHRLARRAVRSRADGDAGDVQDLWTAAKGVYKTEPAVADGGEVVVYAPHVREASHVHGRVIDEIGYHCRDYFLAQWDRFGGYPGGILAHSTHVKGLGTFDARPRRRGAAHHGDARDRHSAASSCEHLNLGYLDPAEVDLDRVVDRHRAARACMVPRAGEMLVPRREASGRIGGDNVKYAMGVVGLGVMGANLARNIESRGFPVVGYDLDAAKAQAFVERSGEGQGGRPPPTARRRLMAMLERPRRILDRWCPPGKPVDSVIAHLQAAPRGGRHPDRRRQLVLRRHRSPLGRARVGRLSLRRRRRVGRRGRRAARAGDHARRTARRRGTRSRRSCARSPPRPKTASRASRTWARAAPATT